MIAIMPGGDELNIYYTRCIISEQILKSIRVSYNCCYILFYHVVEVGRYIVSPYMYNNILYLLLYVYWYTSRRLSRGSKITI